MKRVIVLTVVLVLLILTVGSASAHIVTLPPDPMGVPAESISLNNIFPDPPRPISVMDKDTIVGDIDIDPTFAPKRAVAVSNIVIDPPAEDVVPTDQISLNNIFIDPPDPDVARGGKATPILFRHGAVIIEGTESGEKPPPIPKSGFVSSEVPTDQFSLNGGGKTVTVIISAKRAAVINDVMGDELPPCYPRCRVF